MEAFREFVHSPSDGELNLQDWNAEEYGTLLLDGEWAFYPNRLLADEGMPADAGPVTVEVPGKWENAGGQEDPSPYGFGSYRLLIRTDPEKRMNYSIYVPSVRSASEVYVNGVRLAGSGKVAVSQDQYVAENLPYTTTFMPDEQGMIDLVIQAANFEDARGSGIVRSVKFGTEEAVGNRVKFSSSVQLLAVMLFMTFAVYAVILYFLGSRDKQLLYFSLLSFCVALGNLLSFDEKIFHQLIYMGYEWDFRLANAVLVLGCYALLVCTAHRELPYWGRVSSAFSAILLMVAAATLVLEPRQIIGLFPVYYLLVGISAIVSSVAVIQRFSRGRRGNLLLLLALVAVIHHFAWAVIWRESGTSVVHYPFDLLIAASFLSAIWFKNYFDTHAETRELAITLKRINEQKDQFLANTSHEFKNPLHGMLGMSQSILERERDSLQPRSVKELGTILSVGRRMTQLLNDLLEVRSLQDGNPQLDKKAVRVRPVIDGVVDMLRFIGDAKGLEIVNCVAEDFPPVMADENRLTQIFYNLIHNALKFTDEGRVTIRASIEGEKASFTISDTGIGMDADMFNRLFNPYEQATTGKTRAEGGFGLGLNISRQLIELHEGSLDVSSQPGMGSDFVFTLPLASSAEVNASPSFETGDPQSCDDKLEMAVSDEQQGPEQNGSEELPVDRSPILIVDDDPVNLQVLEALLPADQYDISVATGGREAMQLLDAKEWDLVISDVMMPYMSGYELTREIRSRFAMTELPVLLLTASSRLADIQAGFAAGANDYVTKPVEALELRSRIEGLTTLKKIYREQLQLESAWLQAQIQPHFLFNTLNTVIALSEVDMEKMRHVLEELSHFLQYKFMFQHMNDLIPIEEELSIVQSYLYIEQVRYGDKLHVVWEMNDCEGVRIPFLTIQPLVENAVHHGVMKRSSGGRILIRISNQTSHVLVSVKDDGVGMNEETLQRIKESRSESGQGVGLINTNSRLKRHYGEGLEIESSPGKGTKISFILDKAGPDS